jgi:4-hydroxybenzoate polyprenyltransferase
MHATQAATTTYTEVLVKKTLPNGFRWKAALYALRPYQWAKNLLVFVPIVLGHQFGQVRGWLSSALLFVVFSLCASSAYLLNDFLDLEADRRHAQKSNRPLASGDLGVRAGVALMLALALGGAALCLALPKAAGFLVLAYFAANLLYSLRLKTVCLIDVIVLASLHTLRILASGAATHIIISPWTLTFAMFIFLSLAMIKRFSELKALCGEESRVERRGYTKEDIPTIMALGAASGYLSVLVLALYIHSPEVIAQYRRPSPLWLICPLLAYWISRMWILANRQVISEDPILFALHDKASYAVGALSLAVLLLSI